jgi:hypothetical protein
MGARGRKNSNDLMVLSGASPVEAVERQRPPHDLTDEETEVWVAIVAAEPADWFSVSSRPVLTQYCRHTVHARRIAELLERASSRKDFTVQDYDRLLRMQERESRSIGSLVTKMRITNQSTINHRGNRKMTLARKPWE